MDFSVALLQIKPKLGRISDNLALIQEKLGTLPCFPSPCLWPDVRRGGFQTRP